jgi:dihydrofolate reductase
MRKLIYGINITLDSCCDHTKGVGDEEVHNYFTNLFKTADTLVYGRKTYELMVPFWPDMAKDNSGSTKPMRDFAEAFAAIDKIVLFSRTLDKVGYPKTQIVSAELKDEILRLKQEDGKDILLGGVDLPSQIMALDLIDEYHFVVQPFLAGEGARLLKGIYLPEQLQLKLVDTKVFGIGHVALKYVR